MKTIEENFADWEGDTFGFGYGTGEEHTIAALRAFLGYCDPDRNGSYDYAQLERHMSPTVAWLMINTLCHADVIEYGSSPRFGWLTPTGHALRRFTLAHDVPALVRMTCRSEDADICYPKVCNCGGFVAGKVCVNPFWQNDAASTYLKRAIPASASAPGDSS